MKITNKQNLSPAIYRALVTETYKKVGDFSATEIIGPPRIRKLKDYHYDELEEDCSEHIFRLFGNLIHEMLKLADVKNSLQEERLIVPVNGCQLSLQPDFYDSDKTLWDYKVTSRWVAVFGPKDEWEKQLNIYAFGLNWHGFRVEQAKVCAIFRDWSKTQAARDKDYPQQQVKVFPVKLWPAEDQLEYIEERIRLHLKCDGLKSDELPFCTPEERWAKPDKYAVMRKGRKSAVRVLDSEKDAEEYMDDKGLDPKIHSIEMRPGESTRCEYYCMVKEFCNQYQKEIKK